MDQLLSGTTPTTNNAVHTTHTPEKNVSEWQTKGDRIDARESHAFQQRRVWTLAHVELLNQTQITTRLKARKRMVWGVQAALMVCNIRIGQCCSLQQMTKELFVRVGIGLLS